MKNFVAQVCQCVDRIISENERDNRKCSAKSAIVTALLNAVDERAFFVPYLDPSAEPFVDPSVRICYALDLEVYSRLTSTNWSGFTPSLDQHKICDFYEYVFEAVNSGFTCLVENSDQGDVGSYSWMICHDVSTKVRRYLVSLDDYTDINLLLPRDGKLHRYMTGKAPRTSIAGLVLMYLLIKPYTVLRDDPHFKWVHRHIKEWYTLSGSFLSVSNMAQAFVSTFERRLPIIVSRLTGESLSEVRRTYRRYLYED